MIGSPTQIREGSCVSSECVRFIRGGRRGVKEKIGNVATQWCRWRGWREEGVRGTR